jgi:kumamolisin
MIAVPGTFRAPVPGARIIGPPAAHETIHVVLHVRSRRGHIPVEHIASLAASAKTARRFLTHQELEERYGADPRDIALVEQFARIHGLWVVKTSLAQRLVVLAGTVEPISRAFGVTLEVYSTGESAYRGRVGSVFVPSHLQNIVTGVFGLDNRTIAQPNFQPAPPETPAQGRGAKKAKKALEEHMITVPQLADRYGFPVEATGRGQSIGIIALNSPDAGSRATEEHLWSGGYSAADLEGFFSSVSIAPPTISSLAVLGGGNRPGINGEVDAAVTLDIELAGAAAPGARQVVYFAPNTGAGLLAALKEAVHDRIHAPSVICVSWSARENSPAWTPGVMRALDETISEAALLGITVCCGSARHEPFEQVRLPDFPASSPYALSCGACATDATGVSAALWGQSRYFPAPGYQQGVPAARGRRSPDISACAERTARFPIVLGGRPVIVSPEATSLAAFWSALIALCNQQTGVRTGLLTPLLYEAQAASVFTTPARASDADHGWQPLTGLGSLDGMRLLMLLRNRAMAAQPSASEQPAVSGDPTETESAIQETIRGLNRLLEKSWRVTSMAL